MRDAEIDVALQEWAKELPEGTTVMALPHRPMPVVIDGRTIATMNAELLRHRLFTVYGTDGMPTLLRMAAVRTVQVLPTDPISSYQVLIAPEDSMETIKGNILKAANELLATA